MRILGIDPGSNATGFGIIDSDGRRNQCLTFGEICPKKKDPLHYRLMAIFQAVDDLVVKFQPQNLILEKLYAHHKHPATAGVIGHARGIICLLAAQRNIELTEVSVKRIRKAVTGNGGATKQQTRRMVSHILNLDESKLTLDASDALALAYGFIQMNGRQI